MFKRGAGLAMTLAVAVAAMRFAGPAGPSQEGGAGASNGPKGPSPALTAPLAAYTGGCTAYLSAPDPTPTVPYDDNRGVALKKLNKFFSLDKSDERLPEGTQFAIALAPDPVHTHLSLMFDREIALVQQAAQDEGYIYDSSWFPWKSEAEGGLEHLSERQYAADLTDGREACPGMILFRRNTVLLAGKAAGEAYQSGLVVFVVSEQPTGGIQPEQWDNALAVLRKMAKGSKGPDKAEVGNGILRILGPTFTGSLASLERNLSEAYRPQDKLPKGKIGALFPEARVLSGSVTGCSAIQWFERQIRVVPELTGHVRFGSFQENDALHVFRFLEYMKSQGTEPRDTAILSEDETEYAGAPTSRPDHTTPDLCDFPYASANRPVFMVYPRDISALRDAYQKQSVFSSSADPRTASHAILKDEAEDKAESSVTDTVPAYGHNTSALAQEAYLFGVVSFLRIHHTRYLMLRCTNPLDFLFLTRFFHRAYPEARVVTVGSDLLFRREIDTTEFRGVLALSSYPLIPRGQHWARITEDGWERESHSHLIFDGNLMEGTYIAARYLLKGEERLGAAMPAAQAGSSFLPPLKLTRAFATPDYGDPFWFRSAGDRDLPEHPPTWLVAVGRDGYWPVAVIRDDPSKCDASLAKLHLDYDDGKLPGPVSSSAPGPLPALMPPSTMVRLKGEWTQKHAEHDEHADLVMDPAKPWQYARQIQYSGRLLISFPMGWLVCVLISLFLVGYQGWGIYFGTEKAYRLFSIFRKTGDWSQDALFGVNCALACAPMMELIGVWVFPEVEGALARPWQLSLWAWTLLVLMLLVLLGLRLRYNLRTALVFLGSTIALGVLFCLAFCLELQEANRIPLLYRMTHLTDGVSPLIPILLLTVGFYFWNWNAIAGNLMLAEGRPELPNLEKKNGGNPNMDCYLRRSESRISRKAAEKIDKVALPLSFPPRIWIAPLFLLVSAYFCFCYPVFNPPLLTLEGSWFSGILNGLLLLGFLLTTGEALRLYFTWMGLQRLLQALGRLRLRRTIAQLRPIDARSLWAVSGNVPRIQYRLFDRQIGAASRLKKLSRCSDAFYQAQFPNADEALQYGVAFREDAEAHEKRGIRWYERVKLPDAPAEAQGKLIREVLSDAVAEVLNKILLPEWKSETTSLNFESGKEGDEEARSGAVKLPLSEDPMIRTAEEFVSFHYIAFIQNTVARIRTMTLSMIALFVSVCLAISFYPFVPRTEITMWMVLNLALIGFAVAYVYAGMERDEIMSYIANSKPGELGMEFWLKLFGFLIGPILGILTTQFPSIADSVLGWLQPGLDALK